MSELIVVGFKNERYKANEALNELNKMTEWRDELEDAVAVYRGLDGELRVDQSYDLTTGEGAVWGDLWGTLLGLLVAAPFTAGATAPAAAVIAAGALGGGAVGAATSAAGANWWKKNYGIPEDFVNQAGDMIKPGDSAIFALVKHVYDTAVRHFEGFGGKVLMSTLSEEQDAEIQKVLSRARK